MGKHKRPVVLAVVAVMGLSVYADSAKSQYQTGVKAEKQGDLDAAFVAFKQAYNLEPGNAKYVTAYTHTRFLAANKHIHTGQILLNTGVLDQAMREFQRAAEIDTSSFLAQQEIRRAADMMRRRERQQSEVKEENTLAKLPEDVGHMLELQSLSTASLSLRLTAETDVVYRTLCKLAGINVLTDPDYKPTKITVDLTDVTLQEALDMVRLQSKTFWRPVTPKTILVSADTPAKRKELEQNVMKTFYLRNITTPNELQEAASLVRQILDVNRVQLLQAQDAIVVRGTKDQLMLAEKLLSDFDKPKSEVMIDVAVMEVARDRLRNLGNAVPTTASWSISSVPFPRNGGSGGSGGSGSTGNSTWGIGNFAISVPGGSFTALASESNTKIIQNPEVRALNDEKATLRIGDRVPIATGSFASGIGGGGVSPLVNTQFQYLDVGVNIDLTPHIHSDREVTIKMVLEISSVTGQQNIGGITQPVIGQRRIEHTARLADGDVNLLGGILEDTETQSLSGYPWITKIPILRYLFGQDNRQRTENEIVFAITPHIVRAQELSDDNMRAIEIGTGNVIELRHKSAATPPAPVDHPATPAATKPEQPAPRSTPRTVPQAVPPASAPPTGTR